MLESSSTIATSYPLTGAVFLVLIVSAVIVAVTHVVLSNATSRKLVDTTELDVWKAPLGWIRKHCTIHLDVFQYSMFQSLCDNLSTSVTR